VLSQARALSGTSYSSSELERAVRRELASQSDKCFENSLLLLCLGNFDPLVRKQHVPRPGQSNHGVPGAPGRSRAGQSDAGCSSCNHTPMAPYNTPAAVGKLPEASPGLQIEQCLKLARWPPPVRLSGCQMLLFKD
jgi:hypothetical protein